MMGEINFKKYGRFVLLLFIIITSFLGYKLSLVSFDYDLEKFFPKDDQETDFFLSYREKFSSDNDFILISIESNNGVFNQSFLNKIDSCTKELEETKNISFVNSITNQEEFFISSFFTVSKPYIDFTDFSPKRDSARIYKNEELINSLVARNGKSICLFVKHKDYISKHESDDLIVDLNNSLEKYCFHNSRMAGRIIGQKYYLDKMTFDMSLFIGLSAFLMILFLFIAFKSLWGILIPQVIIISSIIWIVGGMGLFNQPINIVLTVLPLIMFIVAMSDVIHLVSRYLDALRVEENIFKAILISVKEVGMATFLTSITTSIGFFSLYFVNIQPIKTFGIVMGIGVLIAFFLTFLILPILFNLFPGPKYIIEKKENHFWTKHLSQFFIKIINNKRIISIVTGLVLLISLIGLSRINTNNFLMDDLKDNEPIKLDFDFFDQYYGGVRPFEIAVSIKDTSFSVWSNEVLNRIDSIERYLTEDYGVSIKNSLVKTLKIANRSNHSGNSNYYSLPKSQRKIRKFRRSIRLIDGGKFVNSIIDSTENIARIMGTISDLGNKIISEKNRKLVEFINANNLDDILDFKLTGSSHLVDKNLKYLSISLVKGLGISILIVALIIGFIYRSSMILLISIITNLIPLIFIAGIMGFIGIELKTSTSIIFTIAFGIAVDDTIHFLGKFKHELLKGKDKIYALKRTYLTTGKAMILTTLILCSGFLLLIFSSFLGTFYLGLLLCITLFVALIADLTILPILLLVLYKPKLVRK